MSASRILIVEDEVKLRQHLSSILREQGFSVFTCSTYGELENLLRLPVKRFDVIVLDRLLHNRDSSELVPNLKKEIPGVKILVLSAINTSSEKASLLNLGAEDYLAKPFDSQELIARIRVLLRRDSLSVSFGNVLLDFEKRLLRVGDTDVPLTNKEFDLLNTLLKVPGKIINKSYLYEQVWEMSSDVESNVIETTVNKLRKRLKDAGASVQIKNMRNTGYWVEE